MFYMTSARVLSVTSPRSLVRKHVALSTRHKPGTDVESDHSRRTFPHGSDLRARHTRRHCSGRWNSLRAAGGHRSNGTNMTPGSISWDGAVGRRPRSCDVRRRAVRLSGFREPDL